MNQYKSIYSAGGYCSAQFYLPELKSISQMKSKGLKEHLFKK